MAGIAGHVLMDLPTAYGTRLLSPFSETWFSVDWMPIIDVYLWLALIGTLVAGRLSGRRARAATVGLGLLAFDYAGRAWLHQRALRHGAAFDAQGVQAPCASAPTLVAHRGPRQPDVGPIGGDAAGMTACVAAAALPTFVSPFTWRVVRQSATSYEISDRRVLNLAATPPATRITTDTGPEVARARATRAGQVYFDFARFPIARVAPAADTVHLFDARFIGLPPGNDLSGVRTGLSLTVALPPAAPGAAED
jgi:hypothetical protein